MTREEFLSRKDEFQKTRASYEEELEYLSSKCYRATIYHNHVLHTPPEDILQINQKCSEYDGYYGEYVCYNLDNLIKFCCEVYDEHEWKIVLKNCEIWGMNGKIRFDGRRKSKRDKRDSIRSCS